ncbi:unnamed protein product, partial [Staurois parvus]
MRAVSPSHTCIHYIWSPWTLHSLYLVSPDPAFTISGLPRPCIHYIRSPWTLHSLYLVSHSTHNMELHSPKKKKKSSLAIHPKLSKCRVSPHLSGDR